MRKASTLARQRIARLAAKQSPTIQRVEAKKQQNSTPLYSAFQRPLTFIEFVSQVAPHFVWYAHCTRAANVLQRVADRELNRVMFFWPPRHGKSELISRLFSAYWLYRYPGDYVGLASYNADLAEDLSDNARDNFKSIGGVVKRSSASKKLWKTWAGGGMWASGVGGSMTGKGFTLGIVDDPLKNSEEANSATIREKQKDWFRSTFYTRAHPNEAIIVVQTRWHYDDLAGWLLSSEKEEAAQEDGSPERWHIVNFEAIRDFDFEHAWPSSCTVEPDPRNHGDALCPERYPKEKLKRIAARLREYFFGALYQQRPTIAGGGILKAAYFNHRLHISLIPKMRRIVVGVDLAVSAKTSADYTVAFPLGVDHNGRYYLFRPYRAKAESPEAIAGIASRALEVQSRNVGVEAVALGIGLIQHLRLRPEMIGRAVIGVNADKDKETRARGWAPIAEQGLITLVTDGTGWENDFIDEATKFPRSQHDDQVDAVGMAFATLADAPEFGASSGGDNGSEGVRKKLG